ncbi:Mdm33 family-domain-containing protein [Paraphoma chrysanthemicola]|nr:Mdm33 family-domain-containing protein [Paraphoma chrysanthemicola]
MRPLLQHASRSLAVHAASIASSSRSAATYVQPGSICLRCQYRAASTSLRYTSKAPSDPATPSRWSRRAFSASASWAEDRKPSSVSQPISMPLPAPSSKPVPKGRVEDTAPEIVSSLEGQERLQEEPDALLEKGLNEQKSSDIVPEAEQSATRKPASTAKTDEVADNIARVPDEHLPSHRERQRWDFSKRFSEFMDELLPKLAVVTQKVNTYTGTDYSGVEALRREIQEQEKLVKARRAAIDTAKQSLDAAHAQQASAQKEVVALLERKHSWADGDLERYMSLIRSEHINDQAIKQAKDKVISAEAALEEARTQLEKRERAQYHEEQIWSDTIRRNSTWVTFGLMGVNIFLLLLSLAILEPWRRRRMVREIKGALEAQNAVREAAPAVALTAPLQIPEVDLAAIEAEIDRLAELENTSQEGPVRASTGQIVEESPTSGTTTLPTVDQMPETAAPGAALLTSDPDAPQASIDIVEEVRAGDDLQGRSSSWRSTVTSVAQDIVSDRIISIRRIDYTTAILQGAAAGAMITATIIAMLRPN